jgi:MFS transporter, YNFM family, putative membrane transport protein
MQFQNHSSQPTSTAQNTLHRPATVALYFAAVVIFSDMYLTQPILPLLSAEFQVAPATAGLSVSVVVLMIALASLAYGPLSDVLGRKPVMVGCCALLAVPTFLAAFTPSFGTLLLCRTLQGLCIPGLTAVAVSYLGDMVEPHELGSAVGGWIAANVLGGLSGRVVGGLITDLLGWRATFVCFAALTLLCALLLAWLLPKATIQAHGGWAQAYRGLAAHLTNTHLLNVFLIGGALFFGFIGIFTYLPYYLTGAPFVLSPGQVAFAYISYLAGVIISPLAGRASAHWPRTRLITIGLLIAMVGMSLTLIPLLPVVAGSLFIVCTGMFTAQAVAPALVNTLAQHTKGSAGALYLMAYYLGGTLGAVLPGLAWQAWGWSGVVATSLAALCTALVANWRVVRYEKAISSVTTESTETQRL